MPAACRFACLLASRCLPIRRWWRDPIRAAFAYVLRRRGFDHLAALLNASETAVQLAAGVATRGQRIAQRHRGLARPTARVGPERPGADHRKAGRPRTPARLVRERRRDQWLGRLHPPSQRSGARRDQGFGSSLISDGIVPSRPSPAVTVLLGPGTLRSFGPCGGRAFSATFLCAYRPHRPSVNCPQSVLSGLL